MHAVVSDRDRSVRTVSLCMRARKASREPLASPTRNPARTPRHEWCRSHRCGGNSTLATVVACATEMESRMRLSVVATVLTTFLATACGGSGKKPPTGGGAPPPGPKTANVSLADVGLEASSLDKSADPCTDFFQYSCGGWLAANDIPADKARYSRAHQLIDKNDEHVKAILEELAAKPPGDQLGDFYASCLDEAAIEKQGTKSLAPLQKTIDKVKDGKSLQAAIAQLHGSGIAAFFAIGVLPDFADSTTNIIFFDTGGLGLPERDFYVKDEFAPARKAYEEHLVRLFGLLGKGKASKKLAADVMTLETRIAKLTKTGVERRNPMAMYNPTDVAALAKQ